MVLTRKSSACTSILIGKHATTDGTIIIGRNEDAKTAWPKHFIIRQANEVVNEFRSTDNGFRVQLPNWSYRYSATPEWTDQFGLFEEAGINEHNVAMSATESAYTNERVLEFDPLVQDGLNEEAMVTVVLPFITTARAGVLRLGALIEQFGTNETNGILFADDEEAWYMEIAGGHYWVAQRIPDDCYAVVANQLAIQEIDFTSADFLFHPGIQAFVEQHNLNRNPSTFNFRNIFGTQTQSDAVYSTPRVWYGHQLFNPSTSATETPESMSLPFIRKAEHRLSVADAQRFLGSHFEGTVFDPLGPGNAVTKTKYRPISLAKTQESHLLQTNRSPEAVHWLSMGVTAQSVYVPFYNGINTTPVAYQLGTNDYQAESAYWIFKLAGILVDAHPDQFAALLSEKQLEINQFIMTNLAQTDQLFVDLDKSNGDYPEKLTTQSIKLADYVIEQYRQLTNTMIVASTDLSKLNFNTDSNL